MVLHSPGLVGRDMAATQHCWWCVAQGWWCVTQGWWCVAQGGAASGGTYHRDDDDVARRVDGHVPRVDHSPLRRQVSGHAIGLHAEVQVHEGLTERHARAACCDTRAAVIRVDGRGGREKRVTLVVEAGVHTGRHEAERVVQVGVGNDGLARAYLPRTPCSERQ
jgi:hypothetical protein